MHTALTPRSAKPAVTPAGDFTCATGSPTIGYRRVEPFKASSMASVYRPPGVGQMPGNTRATCKFNLHLPPPRASSRFAAVQQSEEKQKMEVSDRPAPAQNGKLRKPA